MRDPGVAAIEDDEDIDEPGETFYEDDHPEPAADESASIIEDEPDDIEDDQAELPLGTGVTPEAAGRAIAASLTGGKRKGARGPKVRGSKTPEAEAAPPAGPEAGVESGPPPTGLSEVVRWVLLGDLVTEFAHWTNPRTVTGLDSESITDLAASIQRHTTTSLETGDVYAGIQDPLRVVQIAVNGSVVNLVIHGQRRYNAACQVFPQMNCLVRVLDLEPEPVRWTKDVATKYLAVALEEVGNRAGLSSYEISEGAARLRAGKDPDTGKEFTLGAIAGAVGRSESWVSKMLKARELATPKLLRSWQVGELTDEQFKDLAQQRDPERQKEAAAAVVEARKQGDKSTGRTVAKEQKEIARAEAKPAKVTAKDEAKAVRESALESAKAANHPTVPTKYSDVPVRGQSDAPARKKPSPAVVEDLLSTAGNHPATHDYVKGILDGVRWMTGALDAGKFAKAWHAYLEHVAKQKAKGKRK